MKTLNIGDGLSLPLDWMLNATVVYGARGSGKTVFGSVLAEEVHAAGQRFCAIDLKGDFFGLKSSADGKSAAMPIVIFGGDHADVPLEPDAGAFVGETVANLEQSCVLDLEHFSKGKQVRFLTAFFAALYDHNRLPIMLLLDECQRYAPQKPIDPDAAKCLGAVEDLVKLGRKHGIGTVLTTQRGSGLNKEVSELCELLVAFRTPGPLDQERIKGWLDANTTKAERESVMAKLAGLPTGTAVFASGHPALKLFGVHKVRMRSTFDSSATPKIGQRRSEPKKLAEPDLAALKLKMAAAIERAKADDPKALRADNALKAKRIAELERQVAAPKPAKAEPKRVEVPALKAADRKVIERAVKSVVDGVAGLEGVREDLRQLCIGMKDYTTDLDFRIEAARKLANDLSATLAPPAAVPGPAAVRAVAPPKPRAPAPRPTNGNAGPSDPDLGKGMPRRILTALAQRPGGLTNAQIGTRAGMSSTSGSFSNALAFLRKRGWLADSGNVRLITADGEAALGAYERLPEGAELQAYWLAQLGNSIPSRALKALCDAYPSALTNEQIGEAAGCAHTSGSFSNAMGKLRKLELASGGRGSTTASAELFG